MKMADVDINPFGDNDKTDAQPDETSKTIYLNPGGVVVGEGATWVPEPETSFRGTSIRKKVLREHADRLYQKPTEITCQTPKAFHFNDFKLYYEDKSMSLTTGGKKLRLVLTTVRILGKEGLCELGFDIPRGKPRAQQAIMLNRVEGELPSASDVAKAYDIELQEIMENAARSIEDSTTQLDNQTHPLGNSFKHPLYELLGLDKELRSIRGLLKVETVNKVWLEEQIVREKRKLSEIEKSRRHQE